MEAVSAIMASIIVLASATFVALIISGAREKEKGVAGFSRIDRSVGAKLELMASILRKLLLTPSALIIVLTLVVALAGMAVLSNESRTQGIFTVPAIKTTGGNLTMIKLVRAVPVNEVLDIVESLLPNITSSYRVAGIYLVMIADKPIRVESVRTPKLVVIGIDSCCSGEYMISCEALDSPSPPFVCVDEYELSKYLYIDGALSVMPIEAFIGNKPVFPPLTSIIVTSLNDASRLLGYEGTMANVVLIRGYIPPSAMREPLGKLVSEVWVVSGDGALILASESVSTLKEVVLAVFLSIAVAVVVSSATRSMTPRVEEIANNLLISGFPSWGSTIIYYVAIVLCSIIATVTYSGIAVIAGLSVSVGHVILTGAFMLASLAHTPRSTEVTLSGGNLEDSFVVKIDRCNVNEFLNHIISAIKRTEFFVIEELTIKRRINRVFVRSRSIFSETWGIGVDIEVLISSVGEASCRVEVEVSDWSIEEISASLTKSVKSLALSRIKSVIELWMLRYYRSY